MSRRRADEHRAARRRRSTTSCRRTSWTAGCSASRGSTRRRPTRAPTSSSRSRPTSVSSRCGGGRPAEHRHRPRRPRGRRRRRVRRGARPAGPVARAAGLDPGAARPCRPRHRPPPTRAADRCDPRSAGVTDHDGLTVDGGLGAAARRAARDPRAAAGARRHRAGRPPGDLQRRRRRRGPGRRDRPGARGAPVQRHRAAAAGHGAEPAPRDLLDPHRGPARLGRRPRHRGRDRPRAPPTAPCSCSPGSAPRTSRPASPVQLIPGALIDLGDGVTIKVTSSLSLPMSDALLEAPTTEELTTEHLVAGADRRFYAFVVDCARSRGA